MATNNNNDAELSPAEIARDYKTRFNFFNTSYSIDFTKKKLDKGYGHGKVNAFVVGDMINPKLSLKRNEINANYIKKNQAVLSKATTGVSTYQYDFCGIRPKKNPRSRSIDPCY